MQCKIQKSQRATEYCRIVVAVRHAVCASSQPVSQGVTTLRCHTTRAWSVIACDWDALARIGLHVVSCTIFVPYIKCRAVTLLCCVICYRPLCVWWFPWTYVAFGCMGADAMHSRENEWINEGMFCPPPSYRNLLQGCYVSTTYSVVQYSSAFSLLQNQWMSLLALAAKPKILAILIWWWFVRIDCVSIDCRASACSITGNAICTVYNTINVTTTFNAFISIYAVNHHMINAVLGLSFRLNSMLAYSFV